MNPENSQVLFGDKAVSELMKGINLVCDATAVTLGPRGRNVAIDKGYMSIVLHDGVSVSTSVNPKNPFQKLGAQIINEAAKKQRDSVGDGTTAVLILCQAILKEALKATSSGINPMSLRKGLEDGSKKVIAELKKLSIPIKSLEQKVHIATISSEDAELGKMIAETIHKIGVDGVITVEESKMADTVIEMQDGMQIDKGWTHPFMITELERRMAILEDTHILITDKPLNILAEIVKFLDEKVIKQGVKKMIFISPEISGDFLTALLGAKINGQFLGLTVKAPMVGSHQTEALQDLCAMTGAKFISKDAGHKFEDVDLTWCGKVKRIVSTQFNTTLTGGDGHKNDILKRIQLIKKQLNDETLTDFDKEKLRERLGKLTDGIAVVKVGGETDVEMKERKERAIDAVSATQAAVKHGIVAGGETALLTASQAVKDSNVLGEQILYHALKRPFIKLVENAGFDGGEMLCEFKYNRGNGLDVTDGNWKDMVKSGIVDPTSVGEVAVKTAVSVAVQIMSIGAAIVPDRENEKTKG